MKRAALFSLLMLAGLLAAATLSAGAAPPPPGTLFERQVEAQGPDGVRMAVKSDVSPPLRSIAPTIGSAEGPAREYPVRKLDKPAGNERGNEDGVAQRTLGALAMPTPIQNFEGIYNWWGGYPPDTVGDVGPTQYVQMVNLGFQVFSKTGVSLYGPINFNALFTGFGGICEANNNGDPVVLYDPLADRWLLTQFAFNTQSGPSFQCFAISTSGDATGSYYRYAFLTHQTTFEDYPHLGVWPDAYYMTANEFGNPSGGGNFAFERDKMLVGDPAARFVYFHVSNTGLLPSDLDGAPPPAGSPNFFMEWGTTASLNLWRFHVDWNNVTNSTFSGPVSIPVASFTTASSVPQPGTTVRLDSISDRIMFRLAYRNFGTHESLVLNHSVSVSAVAGIRWYEVRDPNGTPTAFQQGTFAPGDGVHRWMGSVAMDRMGNIAAGYSASSSTVFPSIRYAGRLVTDPPGQFAQGEAELIAGTGSQTGPASRWGDYSDMVVDPVDDCTFWYTTEYIQTTGERTWRTRIGSFRFPNCSGNVTPMPTVTGTPPTASPTHTPTNTATATATACPGSLVTTGSIDNNDPTQTGRRDIRGAGSTCAQPKTCAVNLVTNPTHYDSYTLTNSSGSAQCITVRIRPDCGNNALFSLAYLGSFNPTALCTNYLADAGPGGPDMVYSFNVPAGATYVVVVHEVNPGIGCAGYSITVDQCAGAGGTATATSTGTSTPAPGTNTNTPSPSITSAPPTNTPPTLPPTATYTSVPSTATGTPVPATASETPAQFTATATTTTTPCAITFSDVLPTDYFYEPVRYLYCRGVISGYEDNTFRPYNNTTRGQLTKIVVLAEEWIIDTTGGPHFNDVPTSNPFYEFIETAYNHGIISGYADGSFKWGNPVTRGQLSKIIVEAEEWPIDTAGGPHFDDVPETDTFYSSVETAYNHGIISGYADRTFRPGNPATRGQISKIVYSAVTQP